MKYLSLMLFLCGCAHKLQNRLANIGETPVISQITNPQSIEGYQPISMPMPPCYLNHQRSINSLWEIGSRGFFKDQRANKIGDIITVVVNINQAQSIESKPQISRNTANQMKVGSFLGFESKIRNMLPHSSPAIVGAGADPTKWINLKNSPTLSGDGKYDITDKLNFKLASYVIEKLPNGNMVIQGRQELRLSNEVREIHMKGIIRREDINSDNTIPAEKIAELRISYGGRGDISDLHQIPWGQAILNKVTPF